MDEKKLIIIRHAETQNSRDRLYQSPDSAILPIPLENIRNAKNKLRELNVKRILVSELNRSIQTAELFGLEIEKTKLLNEFKEPSNLFNKQITSSSSYIFDAINNYEMNQNYTREDGESLKEFIDRIFEFRDVIENEGRDLTVCVGHGFYMRLFVLLTIVDRKEVNSKILSSALSMKMEKLNYASFIFKDGKWFMETWNCGF